MVTFSLDVKDFCLLVSPQAISTRTPDHNFFLKKSLDKTWGIKQSGNIQHRTKSQIENFKPIKSPIILKTMEHNKKAVPQVYKFEVI